MHLEQLILTNFRCFGPEPETIPLAPGLTACIGVNGSGKTAVLQALLRLFGITNDQRRIRRQDFHIPLGEVNEPKERHLAIEAVFAFPGLGTDDPDEATGVASFFHHLAADEDGTLRCRLRLEATWVADGTLDGSITQTFRAQQPADEDAPDAPGTDVSALDRSLIQVIYVPAVRDGASQVTAFLRGRLWRAITWSDSLQETLRVQGEELNRVFIGEAAVGAIAGAVERRWGEVHKAGTDTKPLIRPVDLRLESFVRKVEVVFQPDEQGRERPLEDLSDGQRSLFHIAMTAATLDIEAAALAEHRGSFQADMTLPVLTLLAIEEPENNLAPFYLSRIIRQVQDLTSSGRAQAIVSSHSASILARIDPADVRYFRLDPTTRVAHVRPIRLPSNEEEAGKFIREAVRTYPELYFARFVILGEGSSEEVVIPRLAEAMGIPIDPSFVAVVPLGGRHVNHLWRLLTDLDIPHATLLDLDIGRAGGGWGRIRTACQELLANGADPHDLFGEELTAAGPQEALRAFLGRALDIDALKRWVGHLRKFGVFYCAPLDLDMSMLRAFPDAYHVPLPEMRGPSSRGDVWAAVLGNDGDREFYDDSWDEPFRWYRYLFLGRGKPTTHMRVLSEVDAPLLKAQAPAGLRALLEHVRQALDLPLPE